jgi:hypothetical protein
MDGKTRKKGNGLAGEKNGAPRRTVLLVLRRELVAECVDPPVSSDMYGYNRQAATYITLSRQFAPVRQEDVLEHLLHSVGLTLNAVEQYATNDVAVNPPIFGRVDAPAYVGGKTLSPSPIG